MNNKKQLIRPILFLGLMLLFAHCNRAERENTSVLKTAESGIATITGFIHNRDVYPHTQEITINISHISGRERVTQLRTPINDDGTFRFNIDLARPQDVTMPPFVNFLFLIPNDSLHVELDFANLTDVRLSGGKSADINNDFIKYFNAMGGRSAHIGTYIIRNASWAEIMERLNEQQNEIRDRRDIFLQNNEVHDEVVFLTEAMIELAYYRMLTRAVFERKRFDKETIDKNLLMDKMNDAVERFFHSGIYSNSHFAFIASYTRIAASATEQPAIDEFAIWAEKIAVNDIIRNFMLTVRAGNALLEKDLESFRIVAAHINYDYLFDRVMQEYSTTRMNMLNPEGILGELAVENNPLTNIIASGIGNVQIINISASWCAPCKIVLSETSQWMRELADKDVSFSFISITDDEASRRKYKERDIDLSLVHFTNSDETTFLFRTFSPFGLPHGILINRNGVIVDSGGHVRPGARLRENIDLLLRQDNLVR